MKFLANFKQADFSTSRKHQETGLGLSLTKQLVELHDGFWAESRGEDKGSVFGGFAGTLNPVETPRLHVILNRAIEHVRLIIAPLLS